MLSLVLTLVINANLDSSPSLPGSVFKATYYQVSSISTASVTPSGDTVNDSDTAPNPSPSRGSGRRE